MGRETSEKCSRIRSSLPCVVSHNSDLPTHNTRIGPSSDFVVDDGDGVGKEMDRFGEGCTVPRVGWRMEKEEAMLRFLLFLKIILFFFCIFTLTVEETYQRFLRTWA